MNSQPVPDDLDEIDYSITTRSYRDLSEVQLTDMRLKLTNKAKQQIQTKIDAAVKVTGDTSDGYHTFNELYEFRLLYNAAFANEYHLQYDRVVKSKRHSDGELCFGGGWFVVFMNLPTGQISNHYELKDWNLFDVDEVEAAPVWDGHTPADVAKRLREFLTAPKPGEHPND